MFKRFLFIFWFLMSMFKRFLFLIVIGTTIIKDSVILASLFNFWSFGVKKKKKRKKERVILSIFF